MSNFQTLEDLFKEAKAEHEKFLNGNKAAGTRMRKALLLLEKASKAIRVESLGK